MKYFKLMIIMTLIFIVLACCYLFNYIPIIGKIKATSSAELFLDEKSVSTTYNFLNRKYYIKFKDKSLNYSLWDDSIYDESLNVKMEEKINESYQELIKNQFASIDLPKSIDVYNRFNPRTKDIVYQKIYLLGITNKSQVAKENSCEMFSEIIYFLIKNVEGLSEVKSIQALYTDKNGTFELIINGKTLLTKKVIIDNIINIK